MNESKDAPTWENQLQKALDLFNKEGLNGLRPHKLVGDICRCNSCFCCAARRVYLHEMAHKITGSGYHAN